MAASYSPKALSRLFRHNRKCCLTKVSIPGIFVADTACLARHMPVVGETIAVNGFAIGAGGKKGANQTVAARAGAKVSFISKIFRR